MPQIILLNHAAWANAERRKTSNDEDDSEQVILPGGKPLEKATTDDLIKYYSGI